MYHALAAAFVLSLAACGSDAFKADFEAAVRGPEPLDALRALDQKYPDRLELKLNLGALALGAGRFEEAGALLVRAAELPRIWTPRETVYLAHANLAEYRLRTGSFAAGAEEARRALSADSNDPVGAVYTLGKALAAQGKTEEAAAALEQGLAGRPELANFEDLTVLAGLHGRAGRRKQALDVLERRHERYGFKPGQGLEESSLFEKDLALVDSVSAALMELEYGRWQAGLDAASVDASLRALIERLAVAESNPNGDGLSLARAAVFFFKEDWPGSRQLLQSRSGGHRFVRYLSLAAALETGGAEKAVFEAYLELERWFKDLAGYYHHLRRALKARGAGYSFASCRAVLEAAIALAPDHPAALEARVELGRLLGLARGDGAKILVGRELEALAASFAAGGGRDGLDPLLELQTVPDNLYQLAGLAVLARLARTPAGRSCLIEKSKTASGRLKERLAAITH